MGTMPLPRTRRRVRAFTLIELIVVVIIIAVLASIAAVAYNQFVGNSRAAALTATTKQVNTAITATTARDDVTPAAAVKAAIASGKFADYFGVQAANVAFDVDSATAPKVLQVRAGSRAMCLNLGTEPGVIARTSDGVCSTSKALPDLAVVVAGLVPGNPAAGDGAAPGPAAFTADFTGADNTTLGAPWVELSGAGVVKIVANKAYINYGEHPFEVVDTGITDGTFQATMSGAAPVFAFRVQDKDNYLRVAVSDESVQLQKVTGGAISLVSSKYVMDLSPYGAVVRVVVAGDSITISVNGAQVITASTSAFKSATTQGFLAASGDLTVDDFSATP